MINSIDLFVERCVPKEMQESTRKLLIELKDKYSNFGLKTYESAVDYWFYCMEEIESLLKSGDYLHLPEDTNVVLYAQLACSIGITLYAFEHDESDEQYHTPEVHEMIQQLLEITKTLEWGVCDGDRKPVSKIH